MEDQLAFNMPTGPIRFPFPMQYLGSKARIAGWIISSIQDWKPDTNHLLDVMAGSGAVSHAAHLANMQICANDLQPYAARLLRAAFLSDRSGVLAAIKELESGNVLQRHLNQSSRDFRVDIELEKTQIDALKSTGDWRTYFDYWSQAAGDPYAASRNFDLMFNYYSNTYFGVRQSIEIDALRRFADSLDEDTKTIVEAGTISAMASLASTTTHLAQFLKPMSERRATAIAARHTKSMISWVINCLASIVEYPRNSGDQVLEGDYRQVFHCVDFRPDSTVLYADPPYFKEHYSRYYHVLDTFVLYDYPELTWNSRLNSPTVGRYREERLKSNFGLRSRVASEFQALFDHALEYGLSVALSYASTSLLSEEDIRDIAVTSGFDVSLNEIGLAHSGQGQRATRRDVVEYLFLMKPKGM